MIVKSIKYAQEIYLDPRYSLIVSFDRDVGEKHGHLMIEVHADQIGEKHRRIETACSVAAVKEIIETLQKSINEYTEEQDMDKMEGLL